MPAIEPFSVDVPDDVISDLRGRLGRTRWPDQLPDAGWDYGTERSFLERLCRHWADGFDWDAFTGRANAFPQFVTTVEGQRIHFVHARSPEPMARPLLLLHGWPGSVAEFFDVIGPLSDPVCHGGTAAHAFHVIAPSLPGFGFSGPTTERGWDAPRIARVFARLMGDLGYDRFFAQGGDWGSLITLSLARQFPDRVAAAHVNLLITPPPEGVADPMDGLTEEEAAGVAAMAAYQQRETGYVKIQSTKPQTLGYGLSDSPAGVAGWIVEKFRTWSDCGGDVESLFGLDRLLDNISIYWLTGTINSSIRIYYETLGPDRSTPWSPVTVPLGNARFPAEPYRAPRPWVEAAYPTLVHWSELPRGGHFAAMEVPDLFTDEVRTFFQGRPLTTNTAG
jgi:pimeloyl-ACP methyl ester carboxylesterase